MTQPRRILLIGPDSRGANSLGLANGLRLLGHCVVHVDPGRHHPTGGQGLFVRATRRALRGAYDRAAGREIERRAALLRPDLCIAYKGSHILPRVVLRLRDLCPVVVNVFPDNSGLTHGALVARTLPLYDIVFSTKRFGHEDLRRIGVERVEFVPHGFDPLHHQPPQAELDARSDLRADVSFIGTWSPKKEAYLSVLASGIGSDRLKVWGAQWDRCSDSRLSRSLMLHELTGDLYPLGIHHSLVNVALLSERRRGASRSDEATSRTFHIPASRGFMLHEDTEEVRSYFEEGREFAAFRTPEDLVRVTRHYLDHPAERERIRDAGYERCQKDHSLRERAGAIVACCERLGPREVSEGGAS